MDFCYLYARSINAMWSIQSSDTLNPLKNWLNMSKKKFLRATRTNRVFAVERYLVLEKDKHGIPVKTKRVYDLYMGYLQVA